MSTPEYQTALRQAAACFQEKYSNNPATLEDVNVRCRKSGEKYVIVAEAMYNAPLLYGKTVLDAMVALSKMFGTDDVDIRNGNAQPGCDTCDYGSCYGTELVIGSPTKNQDMLLTLLNGSA